MAPLKHGHTVRSLKKEDGKRTMTPEYRAWVAMKNRCLNPNQARFKDYGGRGIKICRCWLGKNGFRNFLADMGPKPSPAHSMDRKKTDRNYTKSNCKWATRIEQARNARSNRIIRIGGKRMVLAAAVERYAVVPGGTVRQRLCRGWTPSKAIFTPAGGFRGR
jgi:hypothetical protein